MGKNIAHGAGEKEHGYTDRTGMPQIIPIRVRCIRFVLFRRCRRDAAPPRTVPYRLITQTFAKPISPAFAFPSAAEPNAPNRTR